MPRLLLIAVTLLACLSACDKLPGKGDKKDATAAPVKLVVAPEDLLAVQANALLSGPVVTGSIQPERKADLRAEVSAVVLQVLKENGDNVRRGDVLVRLDQTSIRDNLQSAEANARNATQALDQAERNLERLKTLRASGMTSLQALDDAEVRRNAAQSELSASNARAVLARQQLERTVVRAPFDGVVSDRKASAGDTASIGKELLKVIDPTSMRFAGRVSADKISVVSVGQAVSFRVNGYAGQEFRGKVTRVDPSANDVTRQVEVLVSIDDAKRPRVSGLYAEGTIEASNVKALTLPESVVLRAGDKASVWRVKANKLNQIELALGARDPRTGYFEVRSGLADGDLILRSPGSSLKEGQSVELVGAKPPAAAASAASAAKGT
ncbi:MAG: efflux RND transporter periplasmic adaptor subunit [Rhodoferax sp.]|uniref:efflux RND transporter periplasmic adaptor subunit n=1 Tax=Rhodoferax sp. TaxID=50421 RepID=UPI00262A5458|nr:efflux RND transporter periplasmic adaptor subunit [Rhodoferax sp.]MDD5333419.1 efflux RND transporter periplasmic adaptor subunit [Rhodoferax sp.]